jgi:dUTPase
VPPRHVRPHRAAIGIGIDVGAGVIDADYRGPLGVILFNLGSDDFQVHVGDRIAQLVLEQIVLPTVVECPVDADLPALGDRGAAGFGSTGVAATTPLAAPSASSSDDDEGSPKKARTISPTASSSEGDEKGATNEIGAK